MSSSSSANGKSKTKLFLFGATGKVGQSLLKALLNSATVSKHDEHFQITALLRADTVDSKDEKKAAIVTQLKASGVEIVSGDPLKADAAEIAKWIAGYDIVLSAINSFVPGPPIDLKLVEAVKLANVSWFIPALYGIDLLNAADFQVKALPPVAGRKALVAALVAARPQVNSFFFINYLFMEFLFLPIYGVDLQNKTVTAPYDFQRKVCTTSIADIGPILAEALYQRNEPHVKNQLIRNVGDTVTYEQLHHVLEEHFKKPFTKVTATKEETLKAVEADKTFQNFPARYRLLIAEENAAVFDSSHSEQPWNHKHAKHIHTTTVKQFVERMTV